MEYLTMITRTILLYFVILFIFRAMGKREIGELSILDLVVFIMLAEMAAISIEDTSKPLLHTAVPMIVLVAIQILLAIFSLKNQTFREIVDGKPSVLINKGKIDKSEMRKQRYNLDDLLVQLREKKIKNVADVEFAILEPSGKLSVFEKTKDENSTMAHFPFPVIMDGKIQENQLQQMGKTTLWLRQQLKIQGYPDVKYIFYCALKDDGTFYIEEKEKK